MDNNMIIAGIVAVGVFFVIHAWRGEQLHRKDEQLAQQQVYIDELIHAARKLRRAQFQQGQGRYEQRVATPRFLELQDEFDTDLDFVQQREETPGWLKMVGLVFAAMLLYSFGHVLGVIP